MKFIKKFENIYSNGLDLISEILENEDLVFKISMNELSIDFPYSRNTKKIVGPGPRVVIPRNPLFNDKNNPFISKFKHMSLYNNEDLLSSLNKYDPIIRRIFSLTGYKLSHISGRYGELNSGGYFGKPTDYAGYTGPEIHLADVGGQYSIVLNFTKS